MEIEMMSGSPTEIVDMLISNGCKKGSSDIHIDPDSSSVRVRFRKDGMLHHFSSYSKQVHEEVIRRLKILARIRTDDQFNARDGRFSIIVDSVQFDMRTVITPSYFGEAVTMRILRPLDTRVSLETLGFDTSDAEIILAKAQSRAGALLVTGSTGSGKTSTLYAVLSHIADPTVSAITLEDPIEYVFESARQIQISTDRSLSFSGALRSVLRQDPDIILVGEMRDAETARIAVSAALTGHVLLSTMHTRSASGAISRLLEMGIERYFIASAIAMIISQRLIRKLCSHCKVERQPRQEEISVFDQCGMCVITVSDPCGCDICHGTGYEGRICVYEILHFSQRISSTIVSLGSEEMIRDIWKSEGGKSMRHSALLKCGQGIISFADAVSIHAY